MNKEWIVFNSWQEVLDYIKTNDKLEIIHTLDTKYTVILTTET